MILQNQFSYNVIKYFLQLEWILLIVIGIAFWQPSPIRDQWTWLVLLWIPFVLARWLFNRRFWHVTAVDLIALLFFVFGLLSIITSPFDTRGMILLFRPFYGWMLVRYMIEVSYQAKDTRIFESVSLLLLSAIGIISLVTSNWSEKAGILNQISDMIPRVQIIFMEGGFNVNEIAGALTWCLPFLLAYSFKRSWLQLLIIPATLLTALSLILGQSLAGLIGTAVACIIVITPKRWLSYVVIIALCFIGVSHAAITLSPETSASTLIDLSPRENSRSLENRAELWRSAVDILNDYPFTGVGIANYRSPTIRNLYPTPNFPNSIAVHPHNELLQFGADMGVVGMMIYLGLIIVPITGLLRLHASGNTILIRALIGSMIAHAIFGIADAIPIWDRFAFLFWWVLGLSMAYITLNQTSQDEIPANTQATVSE